MMATGLMVLVDGGLVKPDDPVIYFAWHEWQ
jgi:hypothetical protein